MITEKNIEDYLCRGVKRIDKRGRCEKFSSPGRRHVPDRIVTLPFGLLYFVECKRPGQKASPAQAADHKVRRELGFNVWVVSTFEEVDEVLRTMRFEYLYHEEKA